MIPLHRTFILAGLFALPFTPAPCSAVEEIAMTAATECPVRASLAVVPGQQKHTVQLVLTLRIADPWYIYTKSSTSAVLEIDLQLPPGAAAESDWLRPKPRVVYQQERVEVYAGEQTLRRNLRIKAQTAGPVKAVLRFQACDPTICRPPEELSITADLGSHAPP